LINNGYSSIHVYLVHIDRTPESLMDEINHTTRIIFRHFRVGPSAITMLSMPFTNSSRKSGYHALTVSLDGPGFTYGQFLALYGHNTESTAIEVNLVEIKSVNESSNTFVLPVSAITWPLDSNIRSVLHNFHRDGVEVNP
jgi:hypothetical protein